MTMLWRTLAAAATLALARPASAAHPASNAERIALFPITRDAKADPEIVRLVDTLLANATSAAKLPTVSGDALDKRLGGDATAVLADCTDNAACLARTLKKAGFTQGYYGFARRQAGVVRLELFRVIVASGKREKAVMLHLAVAASVQEEFASAFPSIFGVPFPKGVNAAVATAGTPAKPSAGAGGDELELMPLTPVPTAAAPVARAQPASPSPAAAGGDDDLGLIALPPTATTAATANAKPQRTHGNGTAGSTATSAPARTTIVAAPAGQPPLTGIGTTRTAPAAPTRGPSQFLYGGIAAGGLGVVLLGTALTFGIKVSSADKRLSERDNAVPPQLVMPALEALQVGNERNRNADLCNAFLALSGLSLLASAGLVVYDRVYLVPSTAALALGPNGFAQGTLVWDW